ncbi:hypothetical protein GALMADRAFT_104215 [Galerina marginata CBS 339.88]|uniref:Sesquiterpene synthase GALMADRAFT_104215 n=1 Tax=Galerina marginata (strain CBS 339.88) TaxID=685588 RepID=TERS_GALM3|nr:RecName: Full=Sesquiterpene synthase GALMADRAFT_104215; AltName: Full=Terpene cyclase GALMADRAFT_104215 [Galerina marginata CBS 339.88]KDR69261.1 hypothetical protein GALMADRAFT_104215 [Galerina marginata CBS 339.88]
MNTTTRTFYLPRLEDTFSVFPDNGLNPHYAECRIQSQAWIDKYYKIVCGPKMRAYMDHCKFELITAYTYPYASSDGLRKTMDLANILWLYDEFTDTLSGKDATNAAAIVIRTLRERDFDDGSWICHMMRDFYAAHIEKFGPNVSRRFIDHFCQYVEGTGTEAKHREKDHVLDINAYIIMRRAASAVLTAFDLAEYCLGIDLPQYVHDDPAFISGYNAGLDLVFLDNDLFSYDMEQAKGHCTTNIITVVMKSKRIDLQSAFDFTAGYCESLTQQLIAAQISLASRTDPVFSNNAVKCLEAIANWVKGSDGWSFATERYFGKQNVIVKETRAVEMRKSFQDIAVLKE